MYREYFYNSNINKDEEIDLEMNTLETDLDMDTLKTDLDINTVDIETNTWSDSLENILKMGGEKAAGNRELHLNSVRHWKKVSSFLSIPLIFLTTITSISTFNAVNYKEYAYWMYAAGSVNLIAAFLTSLNKYLKPEEKVQAHYQSAKNFGCFYRKLVLELSLSRSNREHTSILTKWAKEQYDKLIQDAPLISKDVIHNYKISHTLQSNTPDIVLNDFTIHINRDH